MRNIDKSKAVMVSGATGYVAGWLVKKLLDEGMTVHAPVRDPENKEKLKYLNSIADKSPGNIKYFKADLLDMGSYDEAMQDCELVFHTASPFVIQVKDPQRDLVDPALIGTRNVLESANAVESVKRVVLTSSIAAIIGDARDILELPNGIANEEYWNKSSTLKHQAYSYSKTLAEKEAWKICEAQKRWDLVVINPSLVIGPGISPIITSESFNIIKKLGDGSLKTGTPAFEFGLVDVRDVATAHFKAGLLPESQGRHIILEKRVSLLQLANILREKFGDTFPFPKREVPKFLVWIMAPAVGVKRKMISRNVGYAWKVDNSKSKRELGMKYMPIEKSIIDFFQQMIDQDYHHRDHRDFETEKRQ